MTDMTISLGKDRLAATLREVAGDTAFRIICALMLGLALFAAGSIPKILVGTWESFSQTAVFIVFAVMVVGYLKASGAETVIVKAFSGRENRMIVFAALIGGLSPFCSCEVIVFISALLAVGTPLSAVMAFWLSSPLMDPPMFIITTGAIGVEFAIAKTVAAVAIGLMGGFGVKLLSSSALLESPLRETVKTGKCCGSSNGLEGKPEWRVWRFAERRKSFLLTVAGNAVFLGKWLFLAYILQEMSKEFVPASVVADYLGGEGIKPVLLASLLGGPAYLNGYAAVSLVAGFLDQGMSQGAAMSFVLAGGISCFAAAIAVWALVKPKVFGLYLGFAFIGSVAAGLLWGLVA